MEKTLRKYGSSSSSSCQLDFNSLPLVIPKRYHVHDEKVQGQDYHLDIHLFNYPFTLEKKLLEAKKERETLEKAAEEKRLAEEAKVQQLLQEAALKAEVDNAELIENGGHSDSDCEVLPEPTADGGNLAGLAHPTNPFLTVSGNVLIPTPSTASVNSTAAKSSHSINHEDIAKSFEGENSNPFDGAEMQSLSNFDALKSVLSPEVIHDVSLLEKPEPSDPVYAQVERLPRNGTDVREPEEPIYSVVNKPPKVVKSTRIVGDDLQINLTPVTSAVTTIHQNFNAVTTPDFGFSSQSVNASYQPIVPSKAPSPTPPILPNPDSCFPKIPEEVIARVMQRLNHDQEKGYEFLKRVLEVMQAEQCDADTAEIILQLELDAKTQREAIKALTQFSELGFPKDDIIHGFLLHPNDRDALLDYLTSR